MNLTIESESFLAQSRRRGIQMNRFWRIFETKIPENHCFEKTEEKTLCGINVLDGCDFEPDHFKSINPRDIRFLKYIIAINSLQK